MVEGIRKVVENLNTKLLASLSISSQVEDNAQTTSLMEQKTTVNELKVKHEVNPERILGEKEIVPPALISLDETEVLQDISEIRLAIADQSYRNYRNIARVILRRMRIKDANSIRFSALEEDSIWEASLPPIGLHLSTQRIILLLRQKQLDRTTCDFLNEITRERGIDFIFVMDLANFLEPPISISSRTIWFDPEALIEMVSVSNEELIPWLSRFIIKHCDDRALLPYQTEGVVKELFIGWEEQLTRLTNRNHLGGIIVGSHRSGKTSFLYQIEKRLREQGSQVIVHTSLWIMNDFQPFFERTLSLLGHDVDMEITLETWAEAIIKCSNIKGPPIFIIDEVDDLLALDARMGFRLGHQMRQLQQNGYCAFYLAGHSWLRKSIELENGPFHNFAEAVLLTGLTEKDGMRLIQEPMKLIGFKVSDDQARRIYHGTSGVPALIQEFCIHLLINRQFLQTNKSEIEEAALDAVERNPEFLSQVFFHFEYAQVTDSKAIMLIAAIRGEITRRDIVEEFNKQDIVLSKRQLDKQLSFLIKFGILEQFAIDRYRILPRYLFQAIIDYEPRELLKAELAEKKKSPFRIDRKLIKTRLYHILKTAYVALLEQRGNGAQALIDALLKEPCPVPGMSFISIEVPQAISTEDEFCEIFLERLVEACHHILPYAELIDKVQRTIQNYSKRSGYIRILATLEILGKEISTKYLVIVLVGLEGVSEEILQNLLLILRELHNQIARVGEGGGKIRFLLVGGSSLWREATVPHHDLSPFNIAQFIFLDGLSYEEIQALTRNQNFEMAVKWGYITGGVPSLIVQIMEGSIDIDDYSLFFEHLYDLWDALPPATQEILKRLVEGQESLPRYRIHYSCPQIPNIDSPWVEAFWEGFLSTRHSELVWRSPIFRKFVLEQTNMKYTVSWPILMNLDLLDRIERLEKALRGLKTSGIWKEGLEDAISFSVLTNSAELAPILEMMRRGENSIIILKHIEYLALTSGKDWIKELRKEVTMRQSDIGNLLIQTALFRAKSFLAQSE